MTLVIRSGVNTITLITITFLKRLVEWGCTKPQKGLSTKAPPKQKMVTPNSA